ncbi:MAG: 6-phosphogluconolactonase [Pseudomonadales bacterium]
MSMQIEAFADRELASAATAELLAQALATALEQQQTATLVVSGGSTPQRSFQHLAQQPLDWQRVQVTLSDERCVPRDHADSNERMVREHLLTARAAAAEFLPLNKVTPATFAAVLLGMGTDGHFASLFPDADNLARGLDLQNPDPTIAINTAASPYPRLSLTLARLLRTDCLCLLAFGADKRTILENPDNTPVAHLLRHETTHTAARNHAPCRVLWAA